MKRFRCFSLVSAAIMAFSLVFGQSALPVSAAERILGDVNGDGVLSPVDAVIYQGWLIGDDNVTILAPENADINGDGKVNAVDLTLVKQALCGGTEVTPPDTPTLTEGKLYQKVALVDQQVGVTAFEGLLPEGWTAQIQSTWAVINPYPGQELVTFTSPDGKAQVSIASPQIYEDASDRGYGADLSNYITLAPYMNAAAYIDYYVQNTYTDAENIRDVEITQEQQADIDQFTEYYATDGINTAIQFSRYPISSYGAEGTISRRQFRLGDGYGEFSCAVSAYQYAFTKVMLNVSETWWQIVNSVAYVAADQDSFERYYDDYEMITTNGRFTAAFFSAANYVAQQIYQMMIEFRTEQMINDLAKSYETSNTPITNSDMETQDRVFQAWDDYIKDEDVYTLSDSTTLRVPTSVDTVAQKDNNIYLGTPGGVPLGYDILTAN